MEPLRLPDEMAIVALKLATNCVAALWRQGLFPEDQVQMCTDEMRRLAQLVDEGLSAPGEDATKLARDLHALALLMSRPKT